MWYDDDDDDDDDDDEEMMIGWWWDDGDMMKMIKKWMPKEIFKRNPSQTLSEKWQVNP